MSTTLTLDKAGRIVVPKAIRDKYQLGPGDALELVEVKSCEDCIVLRPASGNARIRKKHGIWVIHGGAPLSADVEQNLIRRGREERESKLLGKIR